MRKPIIAFATMALSLTIGTATAAAQMTLSDLPGLPGDIDVSSSGISVSVGNMDISTGSAGTTVTGPGDFSVSVPNVDVPEVQMPTINVPGVHVPEVEIPDIQVPDVQVPDVVVPPVPSSSSSNVSIVTTSGNGTSDVSVVVNQSDGTTSCTIHTTNHLTVEDVLRAIDSVSVTDLTGAIVTLLSGAEWTTASC